MVAPKPTHPSRKSKSVGERPSMDVTASPSAEGHDESPEKLSLKARLKLFEKEIEQQGSAAPAPKPGKTFIIKVLWLLFFIVFA